MGSLTTAPTIPAATSAGRSWPSPKCAERAIPLVITEIASAVESDTRTQFTEDCHHAADLIDRGWNLGQLERRREVCHPSRDDIHLVVFTVRQRHDDGVETSPER